MTLSMPRMLKILCCVAFLVSATAASAEPEFLGKAVIPGTAVDLSGLSDLLEDNTPHNRFGGFGSAIDYTGHGNRYLVLADRGPSDGATSYKCRAHLMDITVQKTDSGWRVETELVRTIMLTDQNGRPYVGTAAAHESGLRLDPEGVRCLRDGSFVVSDEYGPFLLKFDDKGRCIDRLNVPEAFLASHSSGDPKSEISSNTRGRQPNRGMEGLAITRDGEFLVGVMQSPLLQDGALNSAGKRVGRNVRVFRVNIRTNHCSQFVYQLDDPSNGVSEILHVGGQVFLVLERDGKSGENARYKRIVRFDISDATDVSGIDRLPESGLPDGVKPGTKQPFLDLLDPKFGLAGSDFPEKVEGMALGPRLPDGRDLLIVTTDNDFLQNVPSYVYAFALDPISPH